MKIITKIKAWLYKKMIPNIAVCHVGDVTFPDLGKMKIQLFADDNPDRPMFHLTTEDLTTDIKIFLYMPMYLANSNTISDEDIDILNEYLHSYDTTIKDMTNWDICANMFDILHNTGYKKMPHLKCPNYSKLNTDWASIKAEV